MKKKLRLLLLILLLITSPYDRICSQPVIFDSYTDKNEYEFGDTIKIVYTIQNPTDTTIVLWFPSTCQLDYWIDDFHYLSLFGCLTTPSSMIIPPDTTIVIIGNHNNSYYLPQIGVHSFMGILLYRDTSFTTFTIIDPSDVLDNRNEILTYSLNPNYPNPFNPSTTIRYQIPESNFVELKVYDLIGNDVATLVNQEQSVGIYEIEFDAKKLPSGIYFYQLKAGSFIETKKMVFLK